MFDWPARTNTFTGFGGSAAPPAGVRAGAAARRASSSADRACVIVGTCVALLCPMGLMPEASWGQAVPFLPVVEPGLLVPPQPPPHRPPDPGRAVAPHHPVQ